MLYIKVGKCQLQLFLRSLIPYVHTVTLWRNRTFKQFWSHLCHLIWCRKAVHLPQALLHRGINHALINTFIVVVNGSEVGVRAMILQWHEPPG